MSDLIAIGYPDETTADDAAAEARRLAQDLIIQPDAIAVIVRDKEGKYHTHTSHHMVGGGATWGMFWGMLFGLLFFIPVLGMAVGAGMGAIMGKITKSGVDKQFQDQVRGLLKPGTSALFLMVEKVTPDKAVEAMSKYGGTVLKTSLSKVGDELRIPAGRDVLGVDHLGEDEGGLTARSAGPGRRAAAVEIPVPQAEGDHVAEPDRSAAAEQDVGVGAELGRADDPGHQAD